jgi:methyl-accepting chemotaxis protein
MLAQQLLKEIFAQRLGARTDPAPTLALLARTAHALAQGGVTTLPATHEELALPPPPPTEGLLQLLERQVGAVERLARATRRFEELEGDHQADALRELLDAGASFHEVADAGVGALAAHYRAVSTAARKREVARAAALETALDEVACASSKLRALSAQLVSSSEMLSAAAASQVGAVDRVITLLRELGALATNTTSQAAHLRTLSERVARSIGRAEDASTELVSTLSETRRNAARSASVVATIDDLAVQTNMVALNAAIQAGRQGSAHIFTTVAAEMGDLARRSKSAARTTDELLGDSVQQVDASRLILERVQLQLAEVLDACSRVTAVAENAAEQSASQAAAIDEVQHAVEAISSAACMIGDHAHALMDVAEALDAELQKVGSAVSGLTV